MESSPKDVSSIEVAVVGGGLVGSLEAIYLAKRGFKVNLYESREDIRTVKHVSSRSINLALSYRGREALRLVGLEDKVIKDGIQMNARLIHNISGKKSAQPYGRKDQFILSVDRRRLNETLLTEAEKYPNINVHFSHKLIKADFDKGTVTFLIKDHLEVSASANLIVGCDGAFSSLRRNMMRCGNINYSQEYIDHGYMELTIPPKDGKFADKANYLHIWPRDEFMLIALPNQNASFTCTLFMPFKKFEDLQSQDKQAPVRFFKEFFSDALPLIGEEALRSTFENNMAPKMVSVKCSPYHFQNTVIMGDAAHAMVPFYGQGMNCGFEDCVVLDEFLDKYDNNFALALPAYSEYRAPDAQAICDLAMYNYIEMRSLVNSRWFVFRKKVDTLLHWLLPTMYVPLYTMVTFSRRRYHKIIQKWTKQNKVVNYMFCLSVPAVTVGVLLLRHMIRLCPLDWLKELIYMSYNRAN